MALSRALQHLLMHPQAARVLGQAAKKALFPRFSVSRRAENFIGIYRELEQDAHDLGVSR
jgi:hypothetical protein